MAAILSFLQGCDERSSAPIAGGAFEVERVVGAPGVRDVRVTPRQARPGDPLTCDWTFEAGSTNLPDASTARWTVDGVEVGTGPTLDTTGLSVGSDIVCEVLPSDGVMLGDPATASARLPGNIVIVVADDVGVDRVRLYGMGTHQPPMPTVEGLAAAGVVFEHAWGEPTCSPGRAAFLTGRDPHQTGIGRAIDPEGSVWLDYSEVTLPELLGSSGLYSSAYLGKWHLSKFRLPGAGYLTHPNDQGFDHFSGVMVGFKQENQSDGLPSDYYSWEETTDGVNHRVNAYHTTALTDEAIDTFDTLPEPFVLVMAYMASHAPYQDPPPSLVSGRAPGATRAQRAANGSIEALDTELGRFLGSVDQDRWSRTTVFFTSDNGTPSEIHSEPFAQFPGKSTVSEGGIWIPLVVAGLGVERVGGRSDHPVQLTDLYATVADLAGVPLDDGIERDSVSFVGALRDPSAPPARLVGMSEGWMHDAPGYQRAVRSNGFKLARSSTHEVLSDLRTVPYETTNLLALPLDPEAQAAYDQLSSLLP